MAQIFSGTLNISANGANDHSVIICIDGCVWDIVYLYNEMEFTFWKKMFKLRKLYVLP